MSSDHASTTFAAGQQQDRSLSHAVVTAARDAILAIDGGGRVTLWNAGAEAMFGWTAAEMLGQPIMRVLPESRQGELARILRALGGTGEEAALETERLHKDGRELPVGCRISPLFDGDRVVGACAVVRDNSREIHLREQLELARDLADARFQQSVLAQATLDPDFTIIDVNPALCALSGYTTKQMLGRSVTEFMTVSDAPVARNNLQRLAEGQDDSLRQPRLLRHADGTFIETEVSVFPVRDRTGDIVRLEASVQDVSAAATAQRELHLRETRWRSLVQSSADVALFVDPTGKLLFASPATLAVFGYSAEQIVGQDGFSFMHPDDSTGVRAVLSAVAAAPQGTRQQFEARVLHADGTWRWVEETITNQLDDPAVAALVANLVDISDRKAAESVLEELAGLDTLTGLSTRAPLMAALDAAFAEARSTSTAVVVLDVDRMKLINDSYGHRLGDDVIRALSSRLRSAVDSQTVVARIGGDRFALLLHDVDDLDAVADDVDALLDAVVAPVQIDELCLEVSAAAGAALGPAVDSGALIAAAESALSVAKGGAVGPRHVVRAETAGDELSRARLVEELHRAIRQEEFVVHFQPIIALADGHPVGAEALVRWQHPDKGLLSPAAFIDVAEDSGLIVDIGQYVLAQSCRSAARWAMHGSSEHPFHVAVNLSAKQLARPDVVLTVDRALREAGAEPAALMIEVTESGVMTDVDAAASTLQQLRALGVSIAVDDFGTGYSSLTYLKRFPLTTVKVDRSFVSGLGSNGSDAAIVTSVVNLARSMRLDCIAEGVETEQQRLVLQALGCGYAQGFLWSVPLDAEAFESWLTVARTATPAPDVQPATLALPAPKGNGLPDTTGGACGRGPARRANRPAAALVPEQVLALMRELHANGASAATIAAALNANSQPNPQGRRWHPRTVTQVLAEHLP